MNCLPVIDMEMRSAARRKWTFTIRLLFAIAGAGTCVVVLLLPRLASGEKGHTMLIILSYLSLAFCLIIGGFLTADCVSSEKREGTPGLLFLTPLKGTDIVMGKMVCHGLQVLYGLCATFPVFFIPLLTGGVTWGEVSRILLGLGLGLFLAASVGIFVSVFAMEARKAMMVTLSSVALIAALPMLYGMLRWMFMHAPAAANGLPQLSPIFTVLSAFESSYATTTGPTLYWGSAIAVLVLSLGSLLAAGSLLGRVFTSMSSGEASRQARRATPVEPSILEQNPYEWLLLRNAAEGRSLGALMRVCIVFFATMLVASVITTHWQAAFSAAFFTALAVHLLSKLRFAIETTRPSNTDHPPGGLELLLATPLAQETILEGHHRAFRRLARKPLTMLIGLNLILEISLAVFADPLHMDKDAAVAFTSIFVGGMLLAPADFSTLRCLGFINGLKASTHVRAALRTYAATMLLPWIGIGLIMALVSTTEPKAIGFALIMSLWVGGCLIYNRLLVRHAEIQLQRGLRRLVSEGF
jgi:ABC-2 family transporter protein